MNERKDQNEKIKELTEQLQEGVKSLFDSDKYREYLQAMAKFHNYSFNNSLLIWAQRPDASAVCGYRGWQTKFGRTVNPGAKGIMIYEPASYKRTLREVVTDENGDPILDKDGNKVTQPVERTFPTFKVGYVFDYKDTSGKPLPSIVSILDKDVDNYDAVIEALRKISPAPIRFADFDGNANGYYDLVNREIVVKASLPQAQKVKSAIHEIAHSILHDKIDGLDPEATKREMEVSAESIAFVVCSWLGLETSEYSFGYVAGWSAGSEGRTSKDLIELQRKMEVIRSTANTIITGLDGELMQQQIVQEEEVEIEEEQEMLQTVTVVSVQKNKPQRSMGRRR